MLSLSQSYIFLKNGIHTLLLLFLNLGVHLLSLTSGHFSAVLYLQGLRNNCFCQDSRSDHCAYMFSSIWIFCRSTPSAPIMLFLDNILKSFKESVQTDAIYLDFRKAFNSIAHNELLTKLWCFGIMDNLWK